MSDERARLFVALELPEPVRGALVDWRVGALGEALGLRFLAPEDMHATLCFLGWRGIVEIEDVRAACRRVAGEGAPELSVGDAVWLPSRRPRVLAVELEDPRGALARVQARLSELLQAGGWYAPEARPFYPHVTAARVRRGHRPQPAELPAPPRMPVHGSVVTLFRSRLGRGGASYEPLERVQLGPVRG